MAGLIDIVRQRTHMQTGTSGILSGGLLSGLGLSTGQLGSGALLKTIGTGQTINALRTKVTGLTGTSSTGILAQARAKLASAASARGITLPPKPPTGSQIIIPATPSTRQSQRGFAAKIG